MVDIKLWVILSKESRCVYHININLNEGMQEVFETIGIKNDYFIAKKNTSQREKEYQKYYTTQSRKKIEREFYADIELGKYTF